MPAFRGPTVPPMRTDPSYDEYLTQWSALYVGKNYDEGLAGYFLAKSHKWCKSAFGPRAQGKVTLVQDARP